MISYKEGDGSTKQGAIVILGANNETQGVDAEYNWFIEKGYLEFEVIDQELLDECNKQYDLLKVKLGSGVVEMFWFDITDFYCN